MKIHLLGLPHTITSPTWSSCAFTNKVRLFAPMMRAQGFDVVHYGNGAARDVELRGAAEHISVMPRREMEAFVGRYDAASPQFIGTLASTEQPIYREYNARLNAILMDTVQMGDVVALPFGLAHADALNRVGGHWIETGVGYTALGPGRTRIYESLAWLHWHLGRTSAVTNSQAWGSEREYVIPNYFDAAEWTPRTEGPGAYVLFMGRIQTDKGLDVVHALAEAEPDLWFVLCGQGDPHPWLNLPNITYHAPVTGAERVQLVRDAAVMLTPTRYVEPFCGVAIEANLCGTPVLASAWGAFTETIVEDVTGRRCRSMSDWRAGLEWAMNADRGGVAASARARYSLERVGPQYARVLHDVAGAG